MRLAATGFRVRARTRLPDCVAIRVIAAKLRSNVLAHADVRIRFFIRSFWGCGPNRGWVAIYCKHRPVGLRDLPYSLRVSCICTDIHRPAVHIRAAVWCPSALRRFHRERRGQPSGASDAGRQHSVVPPCLRPVQGIIMEDNVMQVPMQPYVRLAQANMDLLTRFATSPEVTSQTSTELVGPPCARRTRAATRG